ncbi:MAG: hypothetical protein FJX74_09620, partial [Armatimonadetes bacterium]|nr:hypothetical protein [Armatimonadota bacterium]
MAKPILLLTAPDAQHPFDGYLREVLLTEGYNAFEERTSPDALTPTDLAPYPLVLVGAGAATRLDPTVLELYLRAGGRAVLMRPPTEWCSLLSLECPGQTYAIARDAYLRVRVEHPWLADFPAEWLQLPGEADVYGPGASRSLARLAGQLHRAVPAPAVALCRVGRGVAIAFAYDLADCVVRFHQGSPRNASNGPDPDAN